MVMLHYVALLRSLSLLWKFEKQCPFLALRCLKPMVKVKAFGFSVSA